MTKHLGIFAKNSWERAKYFVVHNILHADDPPHRLALGVGLAMFVTFTPTIGFQMALVFFLAWLFRANKVVGVPLVWISNPATMVPILYFNYCVGRLVGGGEKTGSEWFDALRHPPTESMERIEFYWNRLAEIAIPLWIGSIIVGTTLGVLSYYLTLWSVKMYRLKKWGQVTPPKNSLDSECDGKSLPTDTGQVCIDGTDPDIAGSSREDTAKPLNERDLADDTPKSREGDDSEPPSLFSQESLSECLSVETVYR